ncbi:MAG: phosphotransferase [Nitrospirae bacterium]|nr:phosphotransferase [Nitrospirota bacterium]
MMIEQTHFERYLKERFGGISLKELKRLGEGVHGAGFLVEIETPNGIRNYVIKEISSREDLGHLYPSDRAGVFLLAYDEYGNLPKHVNPVDVLSLHNDGSIKSISGGREYFLLMERAEGVNYFVDLQDMKDKQRLDPADIAKINSMTTYLSDIHAVKIDSKQHYYRKLRDTIGHGECLMGVLDSYPDAILTFQEMASIEKKCIDWRARLKPLYMRLSEIHGDFHPGNILFTSPNDFVLLDRSRGPWGDSADDVTALTINYIFASIRYHGKVKGAYYEGLQLFFDRYIELAKDPEIVEVVAPFFAFRGVVVANPKFYPELTPLQRAIIFKFINNVLDADSFEPERVNDYL